MFMAAILFIAAVHVRLALGKFSCSQMTSLCHPWGEQMDTSRLLAPTVQLVQHR